MSMSAALDTPPEWLQPPADLAPTRLRLPDTLSARYAEMLGLEEVAKRLAALWRPTPPELISKLPRGGDKNRDNWRGCDLCGGWHAQNSIHLDYLGHADTCRIIAETDPFWEWEPRGGWETDGGNPMFIRSPDGYPYQLWIDLVILGFVRPGVGTVEPGKSDPEKELIGDAIRNAAMRFGIAADLWSKATKRGVADLDAGDGPERQRGRQQQRPQQTQRPPNGQRPPGGAAQGPGPAHSTDADTRETLDQRAQLGGWDDEADRLRSRTLLTQIAHASGDHHADLVRSWAAAAGKKGSETSGWMAMVLAFAWLSRNAEATPETLAAEMASMELAPWNSEERVAFARELLAEVAPAPDGPGADMDPAGTQAGEKAGDNPPPADGRPTLEEQVGRVKRAQESLEAARAVHRGEAPEGDGGIPAGSGPDSGAVPPEGAGAASDASEPAAAPEASGGESAEPARAPRARRAR